MLQLAEVSSSFVFHVMHVHCGMHNVDTPLHVVSMLISEWTGSRSTVDCQSRCDLMGSKPGLILAQFSVSKPAEGSKLESSASFESLHQSLPR